jgi:hypothetical protein
MKKDFVTIKILINGFVFKAIKQKLKNTTKINVKKIFQAKLAALPVNLKRIASTLSSLKLYPLISITIF